MTPGEALDKLEQFILDKLEQFVRMAEADRLKAAREKKRLRQLALKLLDLAGPMSTREYADWKEEILHGGEGTSCREKRDLLGHGVGRESP